MLNELLLLSVACFQAGHRVEHIHIGGLKV